MAQTGKQTGKSITSTNPTPSKIEVSNQLDGILNSRDFQATERQKDFLRFVVSETLAGNSHEIKGYTVATRVFGRNESFDPNMDPIVSIQANKLRRALERYYLTQGKTDPILIEMPKGSYVPTFTRLMTDDLPLSNTDRNRPKIIDKETWPTVMLLPFQNLTGDPEKEYWGIGLVTELAIELAKYGDIRVLIRPPGEQDRYVSAEDSRFVINGTFQVDATEIKVNVQLLDTAAYSQIWADVHQSKRDPDKLIAFQENVARVVAVKIAGEHGVISKKISHESRKIPFGELRAYEAIFRYYEWDMTLSPDSSRRALEALEYASTIDPDCGHIWSMLGRLYANIYCLDMPGHDASLEQAIAFSEKGVILNPEDQRAWVTLSYARMLNDETIAAKSAVERALELSRNSFFMLDSMGYLLTLLGDWERGPAIIKKAMKYNPYYGLHVHYALFVYHFFCKDYESAYQETLNFRRPALFWEPLLKAAVCGQMGRYDEGKQTVGELLNNKPGFVTRGKMLMRYFIKNDDVFKHVLDGLDKVGLVLD